MSEKSSFAPWPTARGASRPELLGLGALALAFLALALLHARFTLDDSYIAFRYSQNLAEGHGLAWNPGEDPVEGYTSFLWVALNAAGIRAGLDPVVLSKVMATLAGLGTLWILWWCGRGVPWGARFALASTVAVFPPFAFLAMQGLETALSTLLATALALLTLRALEDPPARVVPLWYAVALIAALCRPDAIPFGAGLLAGLVAVHLARGESRALRPWTLYGIVALVLGGAYFGWRVLTSGTSSSCAPTRSSSTRSWTGS